MLRQTDEPLSIESWGRGDRSHGWLTSKPPSPRRAHLAAAAQEGAMAATHKYTLLMGRAAH